jgi:hypothetical protein
MLPAEKGRFCKTCQKCVVDFSAYTDTEIVKYLTQNTGKTCGRFSPEQLNRPLEIEKPYPTHRYYKFFTAVALFLGVQQLTYSQTAEVNKNVPVEQSAVNSTSPTTQVPQKEPQKDSLITFTGQVLDSATKEPLFGVALKIKGSTLGTSTDLEGNFSFSLPANYSKKELVVEMMLIGYKKKEMKINPRLTTPILLYFSENDVLYLGDFVGLTVYDNRWQQFKHRVANFFNRLF